jgi:hypothetical protein
MWQDFCGLCGIRLVGPRRRYCSSKDLRRFAQGMCKETEFLFRALELSYPDEGRYSVCIPCVNWKRRVELGSLRRRKKPYLQMDSLVLYLLHPGLVPEPDHRCMERLICAGRQKDNPYRAVFPLPILSILDRTTGNTYLHAIAAWWEYNGRTMFFQSAQVARRVRCAIKSGLVEAEI